MNDHISQSLEKVNKAILAIRGSSQPYVRQIKLVQLALERAKENLLTPNLNPPAIHTDSHSDHQHTFNTRPLVHDHPAIRLAKEMSEMAYEWCHYQPSPPAPAADAIEVDPTHTTAAPNMTTTPMITHTTATNSTNITYLAAQIMIKYFTSRIPPEQFEWNRVLRRAFVQYWTSTQLRQTLTRNGDNFLSSEATGNIRFMSRLISGLQQVWSTDEYQRQCHTIADEFQSLTTAASTSLPSIATQLVCIELWSTHPFTCPADVKRCILTAWLPPLGLSGENSAARQTLLNFVTGKKPPPLPKSPNTIVTITNTAASPMTNTNVTSPPAPTTTGTSLVLHQRSPLDKCGLDNLGNTCYLNSVLQSLFMTDGFRSDLIAIDKRHHFGFLNQHNALIHLQTIFSFLVGTHRRSYSPQAFVKSLPEQFRDWTQQDAGEFAKYVLDVTGSGLKKYKRLKESTNTANTSATASSMNSSLISSSEKSPQKSVVAATAVSLPTHIIQLAPSMSLNTPIRAATIESQVVPMQIDSNDSLTMMKGGSAMHTPIDTTTAMEIDQSQSITSNVKLVPSTTSSSDSITSATMSTTLPTVATSSSTVIDMSADEYFGGQLLSTITCLTCGTRSSKIEPFLELPLALEIEKAPEPPVSTDPALSQPTAATLSTTTIASPAQSPSTTEIAPIVPNTDSTPTTMPSSTLAPISTPSNTNRIDDIIAGFLSEGAEEVEAESHPMTDVPSSLDSIAAASATTASPTDSHTSTLPSNSISNPDGIPSTGMAEAAASLAASCLLSMAAQSVVAVAAATTAAAVATNHSNGSSTSTATTHHQPPPPPAFVVPSGPLHLNAMISHYFSSEELSGSNAYRCDQCATKRTSTKQLSLIQPIPPHLLICLKRNKFEFTGGQIVRNKILKEVDYPCILKVPIHSTPTDGATSPSSSLSNPVSFQTYILYSAIFHSGVSAQHGHYYSIARHSDYDILGQFSAKDGKTLMDLDQDTSTDVVAHEDELRAQGGPWYCFNDSHVTVSSFREMSTMTKQHPTHVAYLLFYRSLHSLARKQPHNQVINEGTILLPPDVLVPITSDNKAYAAEQRAAELISRHASTISTALANRRLAHHETKPSEADADYDADMC